MRPLQAGVSVRWEGDGKYTPLCEPCGYEGKSRGRHSDALAAARQHQTSQRHRKASLHTVTEPAERERLRAARPIRIPGPPGQSDFTRAVLHAIRLLLEANRTKLPGVRRDRLDAAIRALEELR